MYEPNVARTLALLSDSDVVLDIGGWARPFNRADYVLDAEPWETRGYYGAGRPAQGGEIERFSRDTWLRRDICEHTPFPFADKSVDFVICSHTLEDIRDPLWVCAEMMRIGRRGYIEVPSRLAESCRGTETGQVGWSHHRWLVDIEGSHIRFLMKYHRIHSHWRLSLPASTLASLGEAQQVQWLFWTDRFTVEEVTIHGVENIERELEAFVASVRPYPRWLLNADAGARHVGALGARASRRARRWLTGATRGRDGAQG
jgi:methyltransferase family protein